MKDGLENIDEVFKQAFDGFEANVDPSVWTNIQSGLNAGATSGTPQVDPVSTVVKSSVMKSAIVKIAATVVAVGTIATASYYVATSGEEKEKVIAENVINETLDNEDVLSENEKEAVASIENESVKTTVDTENEAVKRVVPTVENEKIVSEVESNVSDNTTSEIENNNTITETSNNQSAVSESENETPDLNESNQAPTKTADKPKEKQPEVDVQPTPKEEQPEKKEAVVNTIPNVITPNGDGQNDVIKIEGENLDKMELVIMDKTGKIIYKMTNIEQEWDGKDMNGFDVIQGTYYIAGTIIDADGNIKKIKQAINLFK